MKKGRRDRYKPLQIGVYVVLAALLIGLYFGYRYYKRIFFPNVFLESKTAHIHIPTGATYETVKDTLEERGILRHRDWFDWVADQKGYPDLVKPGRYALKDSMSSNELVDLLRSGKQDPVQVSFHGVRKKSGLAGRICGRLECDSAAFLALLNDPEYLKQYGVDKETALVLFIPNTYELYWNSSAKAVFRRMVKEWERFWNEERRRKAEELGLTPVQVSILASIVQAEQEKHPDERPIVAGLFLNRLERGMKLQSDPTLVYAIGDPSIERVHNKDKEVDSPYNTYEHKGLPPGPINVPEISSIEAVLEPDTHDYLFMCAKPDTSGYHNFARTGRQHRINAEKYQRWLDEQGIYR